MDPKTHSLGSSIKTDKLLLVNVTGKKREKIQSPKIRIEKGTLLQILQILME